jgi:hypothetical protein
MQTLRLRLRSESLIRSSLWTHNWSIRFRTSRIFNWAEIIGTLGRLRRIGGDKCGGPKMSESSSATLDVFVVGNVMVN